MMVRDCVSMHKLVVLPFAAAALTHQAFQHASALVT